MDEFYPEIDDDFFFEEEILTPEEQAASDRAQARLAHEEAIGELYASQFAFDWFDKAPFGVRHLLIHLSSSLSELRKVSQIPQNVVGLC